MAKKIAITLHLDETTAMYLSGVLGVGNDDGAPTIHYEMVDLIARTLDEGVEAPGHDFHRFVTGDATSGPVDAGEFAGLR